uniref:PR domain containing 1b, with ZNF domain n=1 Tax=Oryzias latipes TaxID=8090 RepID=A0A3P9MGL9_ORYLA
VEELSHSAFLQHFIDGYDVHKSNWMRYVNPARSPTEQNTVACQNGRDIYFYTMRPVEPKQELLVWYSKEFSQRLCSHSPHHDCVLLPLMQKGEACVCFLPAVSRGRQFKHTPVRVKVQKCVSDRDTATPTRKWEKIDVEMLDRDTPPDTPEDQIMDFSKKVEMKDEETWGVLPPPHIGHRGLGQAYLPEQQVQSVSGNLPLHLHGLYGHREGLVSSYPLYPQARPLQPSYQFLSPYHYPRLLLPSCSPPFPGMLPSRGAFQYGGYLSADRLPYPPIVPPTLLPMSIPYAPSTQGGLKEQTPNVSPPRGSPATPELSPPAKPSSHLLTPEPSPSGCEEAMNLSMTKSGTAPRNGPGHKSLPYPLKKQNGKIKYECNICSKTFGQLSNLKVHHLVHTGEKPHECQIFQTAALLSQRHPVLQEMCFSFQVCHKRFSSTSNLKTHLRLHSGEKPYQCKLCNTKFTQYIHLKLHRRLHSSQDRPNRCQRCTQAFFHRFSLCIHQTSCCPAGPGVNPRTSEMVERFDGSQEAAALPESASPSQLGEAVEHWLARTLEGEGKEDQKDTDHNASTDRGFIFSFHPTVHLKTHFNENPVFNMFLWHLSN